MTNDEPRPMYEVVEERVWIPVRDGTRLAAILFRPESDERFPAILEYRPYRKDDLDYPAASARFRYFAERGYVGASVDIRGTGSSEGAAAENEYVLQEQLDGYDVIEWLADQDWCTGKVGMQGGSYLGFNSVLVASHNPPHLAAISPLYFADDGYTDGDHFEGGCLSAMGLAYYGLSMHMLTMNTLPPDPVHYEETAGSWEESWRRHLQEYEPWVLEWFNHPTNDSFWRVQSLRPDYQAIKCPVFMIGGWGDHFRNAIPRMLQNLEVPRKAIIGPWVHTSPSVGHPGPNIDHMHELLRWWDYWLKGLENGVMDEPALAVFVQRDRPPGMFAEKAEGSWRFEEGWPLADVREDVHYFGENGVLSTEKSTAASQAHTQYDQYVYRPDVGVMGNVWVSQANTLGEEQSLDEAFSLTYTSVPLTDDLEILGFPRVQLHAATTAENTAFVVKLTEVNSEGQSNLVTYGVLNASHRYSHEKPEALEPGKIYTLDIEMSAMSWVFKKGHRIRVSVSSSHWPILWPLPEPAVNQIYFDEGHPSKLILPVVPPREAPQRPDFRAPPEKVTTATSVKWEPSENPSIKITRDVINQETSVEVKRRTAFTITDRPLTFTTETTKEARTSTENPAISSVRAETKTELLYPNGLAITALGSGMVSSNRKQFVIHLAVDIRVNGASFFEKTWLRTVPRYFI